MKILIEESEAPVSDSEISSIEMTIGHRLPHQYRQFLLLHIGGRPVPNGFRCIGPSGSYVESCVAWFFSIYDGEYENFLENYETYKVRNFRLPTDLIAIGRDPGGDLICISVGNSDEGAVYYWNHDEEADGDEIPGYSNVYPIADSFDKFISGLYE